MTSVTPQTPTPSLHTWGSETRTFYLTGNPWKAVTEEQRLFRCCIVCGENRFSDEEWPQAPKSREINLLICDKSDCNTKYFVQGGKSLLTLKDLWIPGAYEQSRIILKNGRSL